MPALVAACTRRVSSGVRGSWPFTQWSTCPPLRPLAPWPSTPASRSAMPRPGCCSRRCHALDTPVKPPPMMATSVTSRPRSAGAGSGGALSATQTESLGSACEETDWSGTGRNPESPPSMPLGTHVRLCLKDLYSQDVVEMIERETRKYEVESIEHPDHPDFQSAYQVLWDGFGAAGEMESEAVVRRMLLDDPLEPLPSGSY